MQNAHERVIEMSAELIFERLTDMGTEKDVVWPKPETPFKRTPGEMIPGVTTETHGGIRAMLQECTPCTRIAWTLTMDAAKGSHVFTVEAITPSKSLVRHVLDAEFVPAFAAKWDAQIKAVHDEIIEGLLDNLDKLARAQR